MAAKPTVMPWSLTVPGTLWDALTAHLFPGDGDEHGAVISCGIAQGRDGLRLLARELVLAGDGVDYLPGTRGYRQLTASFVTGQALHCRRERLAYLAVHNHHSGDHVGFSGDDLASHERGYPALVDIVGRPVGALVLSQQAVAGDLWLPTGRRADLRSTRVLGASTREVTPRPRPLTSSRTAMYDRQSRMFGEYGQAVLAGLKVGVVGAGGAGNLLVEYLARLGVGYLVVADPERVDLTNVPRLTGATRRDAGYFQGDRWPARLRSIGARGAIHKVRLAHRIARRANPTVHFVGLTRDFVDADVAHEFVDCDYLFLAADSMRARLLANAIVQQYLIPGVQIGAKVRVQAKTGALEDVFSIVRPMVPGRGCLWCNGLIPPGRLADEAATARERAAQRYVEDTTVVAPSVITLNATAAAHAADDFLFRVLGLRDSSVSDDYLRLRPTWRALAWDEPRQDPSCPECGSGPGSRLARGYDRVLPTRPP